MSEQVVSAGFSQASANSLRVIGYASGNFAKALQAGIVDIFYLYFLITTVQLPASLAGTVLLAGLIFDGVSDPVVSRLIDKYGHRFKSLSVILLMVIPLNIVSFCSLFILPVQFPGSSFIAAIFAMLLFRIGYTLVDIPHNALLAGMARLSKATIVSAWRFCFSAISVLFLAALSTIPMFNPRSMEIMTTDSLARVILGVGVLYMCIITISALSCRSVLLGQKGKVHTQSGFLTGLKALLSQPDYCRLLMIIALICCFVAMAERSTVFLVGFASDRQLNTWELLTAIGLGKLLSLIFWVRVSAIMGERKSFQYAFMLCVVAVCGLTLSYPHSVILLTASYFILGISIGGISVFVWSLLAKVVNGHFADPSLPLSTLAFGIFLLVLKVAAGIGSFILSLVLENAAELPLTDQQTVLTGLIFASVTIAGLVNIRVVSRLDSK